MKSSLVRVWPKRAIEEQKSNNPIKGVCDFALCFLIKGISRPFHPRQNLRI
jgi:hypothetical protein